MQNFEFPEVITIVEPHHDDFALSIFGTMLKLDQEKRLRKLIVHSVFGVSPGVSKTPTKKILSFIKNAEVISNEYWYKNIMKGGHAAERKAEAEVTESFEKAFEDRNNVSFTKVEEEIIMKSEGLILLPMGYVHPDHNLLARIGKANGQRYFYREYPYYWHRKSESYCVKFKDSLYEYPETELLKIIKLGKYADWKWKIVPNLYKDIWGQFNPLFPSARPWYKEVRDEAIYIEKEK